MTISKVEERIGLCSSDVGVDDGSVRVEISGTPGNNPAVVCVVGVGPGKIHIRSSSCTNEVCGRKTDVATCIVCKSGFGSECLDAAVVGRREAAGEKPVAIGPYRCAARHTVPVVPAVGAGCGCDVNQQVATLIDEGGGEGECQRRGCAGDSAGPYCGGTSCRYQVAQRGGRCLHHLDGDSRAPRVGSNLLLVERHRRDIALSHIRQHRSRIQHLVVLVFITVITIDGDIRVGSSPVSHGDLCLSLRYPRHA